MRRKLLGPLLLLLIIVAACQNEPEKRADDAELAEEQASEEEKEQPEKGQEEPEESEYEIDEMFSIVPIDKSNEKVAFLTIDDEPDKHALEMAQQLKEMDANAIFFVNGHFL